MNESLTPYKALFAGRRDCYGTTGHNGRGVAIKEPLTEPVLEGHLAGKQRIGVYSLVGDKCKFAVVDIDQDDFSLALAVAKRLKHYGLPAYIEKSKAKGYHVWLFFSDWVLACKIRSVLKLILRELELDAEIFPKQDLAQNGLGNYIYLPFFNLENHNGRTVFVDEHGSAYPDQVSFLRQVELLPGSILDEIIKLNALAHGHKQVEIKRSTSDNNRSYKYVDDPFTAIFASCEALDRIRLKAKEEGHLEHDERMHIALVVQALPDGENWVIENIFSLLSDYEAKTTEYQLNSLKGNPTLCKTMCKERCEPIKERGSKSPVAFAIHKNNGLDKDEQQEQTPDPEAREDNNQGFQISLITNEELMQRSFDNQQDIVSNGILPYQGKLVLAADSGTGKSLLTLQWAIELVTGMPFLGKFKVLKPDLRILFIQQENPMKLTHIRMKKLLTGKVIPPGILHLEDPIRIEHKTTADTIINVMIDLLKSNRIDVWILDPLASFHNENENDNAKMRSVLDRFTFINAEANTACIIVHHFRKPQKGENDPVVRMRGASAIKDWADTLITLTPHKEDRGDHKVFYVEFGKIRWDKEQPPLYLERSPETFWHTLTYPRSIFPPQRVRELLIDLGGEVERQGILIEAIMEEASITDGQARKVIKDAIETGAIKSEKDTEKKGKPLRYYVCDN